jgi:hypothetical protein
MQTKYGYQIQFADIDISAAATTELVAAVSGHQIRVVSLFLRSDDVNTVQFLSGATAIGGTMRLIDADQIKLNESENGHFETGTGEALNISTSAAKQISGWLGYFIE